MIDDPNELSSDELLAEYWSGNDPLAGTDKTLARVDSDNTFEPDNKAGLETTQNTKSRSIKKRSDDGWWKPAFLDAFRKCGTTKGAADAVGISASIVRRHRQHDSEFDAQMLEVFNDFIDGKEEKAWERAEKSDTMLIFMLKGARPEKYRDFGNQVTVNNTQAEQILVELIPFEPKQAE